MPAAARPRRRRFRLISGAAVVRLFILGVVLAAALGGVWFAMIRMPGASYAGPPPRPSVEHAVIASALRYDVQKLAGDIGGRSLFYPRKLADAAAYIRDELVRCGYPPPREISVERAPTPDLEVTVPGTSLASEIVVIGAHYDAFQGTPGADDNASGVAMCLTLARQFRQQPQARTLRFVFFVNEEPPSFQTSGMGSLVYARECHDRAENISAMLSIETVGYFSDVSGSQKYPFPFGLLYPDTGNFIAFVGNITSRALVHRAIGEFRAHAKIPSDGGALPASVPGVGWSDHWSFWQCGYPAIMITDTAPFRNPNYHLPGDTPDTLDYTRMALVAEGLQQVVKKLAAP